MISNTFYRPKLESGVKATKWSPCSVYTSSLIKQTSDSNILKVEKQVGENFVTKGELILDAFVDDYLESDKIIYKTVDNKPITLTDSDGYGDRTTIYQRFGANLVSNTYENGIGTLTFDRPITDINYGFPAKKTLQMLKLPTDLPTITQLGSSNGLETHLTDVYVGQNTRNLTGESFYLFKELKNIHLDKDSPYYKVVNGALYTKNMDRLVFIPPRTGSETLVLDDKVRIIDDYALYGNTVVKKITANNIDSLDCWFVFNSSYVEEIEIGGTVTKVEGNAFTGAFRLGKIVLPPTITTIESRSFDGIHANECHVYLNCPPPTVIPSVDGLHLFEDTNEYIHVPKEYVYDYLIDDVWPKFNIVIDGTYEVQPSKFEILDYNTQVDNKEDFCVGEYVSMGVKAEPEIYAKNWIGKGPISRDTSIVNEQGLCLVDGTVELYCESYKHSVNSHIQLIPATATKTITVKPVKFIYLKDRFYTSGNKIHERENVEDYGILKFTYTSSNPEVATVDQNGVITKLTDGSATIKVTLKRQTVDGVVYKPELYSIGGGDDYYDVEMKKLFY